MPLNTDIAIVGAGFSGAVLAERLAAAGHQVLLIDRRDHVGGNCHDCYDEAGVLIQPYGPHIFHTSDSEVFSYLCGFTQWHPYVHKVIAWHQGAYYPVPINLAVINRFFHKRMKSEAAQRFLAAKAIPVASIANSRDVVVSKVGIELYTAFIEGYTQKQWDRPPEALDKQVLERLKIRWDYEDRYFFDPHQGMPKAGFHSLFKKMLASPRIRLLLKTDYRQVLPQLAYRHLVITSPIDEYYDYRFGRLQYRAIRLEFETLPKASFQPNAVVNYPALDIPYTRITEFKKFNDQRLPCTTICREYAQWEGEPSYPIPSPDNFALFNKYQALAAQEQRIVFAGRLGSYRYMNMDQAVRSALDLFASRSWN